MKIGNEFIPYEQALALKELGFDEPCFAKYQKLSETANYQLQLLQKEINCNRLDTAISAPLYQQVFRWFREKHNYWSYIFPYIHKKDWNYHIQYYDTEMWGAVDIDSGFKTYEESELECLKKLIEIYKKEKGL